MILLDLTLFILLFLTAYQDFKYRAISVWILPILFIICLALSFSKYQFSYSIINSLINVLFFLCQLLVVTIYFSLKEKRVYNIINTQIGVGDIFFILALSITLPTIEFIIFLSLSYLIILIIYLIANKLKLIRDNHIPLAGGLSISFAIFWLFKFFLPNFQILNLAL